MDDACGARAPNAVPMAFAGPVRLIAREMQARVWPPRCARFRSEGMTLFASIA
jgi:hypothetical protein